MGLVRHRDRVVGIRLPVTEAVKDDEEYRGNRRRHQNILLEFSAFLDRNFSIFE
jgi:hypothetical protein